MATGGHCNEEDIEDLDRIRGLILFPVLEMFVCLGFCCGTNGHCSRRLSCLATRVAITNLIEVFRLKYTLNFLSF